ncbi:MAG TPA: hypothetical protein PKW33_01345 [Anaerolineaceae bacterium]|nr:hypothetical protein [Anaerolineaceae bacterium]HPN50202.1 hypothetical protein [Anaerolineaceae bacterium]
MTALIEKHEKTLIIIILAIALMARLWGLASPALNDSEASQALQALSTVRGEDSAWGSQALYLQATTFVFYLAGANEFTARLIPALLGTLIVFVPLLFRRRLGLTVSLLTALFLAIDPGLVSLSRQAGGMSLAMVFAGLALGFWDQRRVKLAGVSLGLGLMSGPQFWVGALIFGLTAGVFQLLHRADAAGKALEDGVPAQADQAAVSAAAPFDYKLAAVAAGITVGIVGSLFLANLRGLSATASALADFFAGWVSGGQVSILSIFLGLLVYYPLALGFGLVRTGKAWWDEDLIYQLISLWFILGLVVLVIYPGRQMADLIWVAAPLWALAAREIEHLLTKPASEWVVSSGYAILVFVLLVFTWQNLSGIAENPLRPEGVMMPAFYIMGAVALGAVGGLLLAWGWGGQPILRGLGLGLLTALMLYSISLVSAAGQMRETATSELWVDGRSLSTNLVVDTVDQLSLINHGVNGKLDVVLQGIESPSLKWALRNYALVEVDMLPANQMPSIVISPVQEQPVLAAAYRGQGLVLSEQPGWPLMVSSDFLPWLVAHDMPQNQTQVILWVRNDLFAGGSPNTLVTQN